MVKSSFIEKTYVVGTHWNCLYEGIPMCTNNIYIYITGNEENYFYTPGTKYIYTPGTKYIGGI